MYPAFVMRNLLADPTCKSSNSDEALLAVSVTLSLIAVGVPLVFHVPARFTIDVASLPVREYPVLASTPVFAAPTVIV
jgi:hypothetical protein